MLSMIRLSQYISNFLRSFYIKIFWRIEIFTCIIIYNIIALMWFNWWANFVVYLQKLCIVLCLFNATFMILNNVCLTFKYVMIAHCVISIFNYHLSRDFKERIWLLTILLSIRHIFNSIFFLDKWSFLDVDK